MHLEYTNEEETSIKVVLEEGENLDDVVGPAEIHVPTDPDNRHYAEILKQELKISAYNSPVTTFQKVTR